MVVTGGAMLKRFSIWLENKSIEDLKELSKVKERPIGWIVRKAVEEYIERQKQKGAKR
jgi:predicted DNA-binding protein